MISPPSGGSLTEPSSTAGTDQQIFSAPVPPPPAPKGGGGRGGTGGEGACPLPPGSPAGGLGLFLPCLRPQWARARPPPAREGHPRWFVQARCSWRSCGVCLMRRARQPPARTLISWLVSCARARARVSRARACAFPCLDRRCFWHLSFFCLCSWRRRFFLPPLLCSVTIPLDRPSSAAWPLLLPFG